MPRGGEVLLSLAAAASRGRRWISPNAPAWA